MTIDAETQQDRRLQTLVYDLDKKVHTLEMSDQTHRLKIAFLEGEIGGLRSSTASSTEVSAASKLIDVRFDHLQKDVAGIRAILIWSAVTFIGIILAAFQFKIVVVP